jgi:hypothetical protein
MTGSCAGITTLPCRWQALVRGPQAMALGQSGKGGEPAGWAEAVASPTPCVGLPLWVFLSLWSTTVS